MNKLFLMIFIALWGGESSNKPVAPEDDCRKLVTDAYSKLELSGKGNTAQGQLLEFKTTTYYKVPGEDRVRSSTTTTKMVSYGDQVQLENEEVSLVKDSRTTVAVLKGQRQVLVSNTAPGAVSGSQLEMVRDLLLKEAKLTGCGLSDGMVKEVAFSLPENLVRRYQITSMRFWVSQKQKQVRKVELHYTGAQAIERQLVEFLQLDHTVDNSKKLKSPLDLVLDTKGRVLPAFKGYSLIDTRR